MSFFGLIRSLSFFTRALRGLLVKSPEEEVEQTEGEHVAAKEAYFLFIGFFMILSSSFLPLECSRIFMFSGNTLFSSRTLRRIDAFALLVLVFVHEGAFKRIAEEPVKVAAAVEAVPEPEPDEEELAPVLSLFELDVLMVVFELLDEPLLIFVVSIHKVWGCVLGRWIHYPICR